MSSRSGRTLVSILVGLVVIAALLGGVALSRRSSTVAGDPPDISGGTTTSRPQSELSVEGAAHAISTDPAVTLKTRLSTVPDGRALLVELSFRNLSAESLYVNWLSYPPGSTGGPRIEVEAPEQCGSTGYQSFPATSASTASASLCDAFAAEFLMTPNSDRTYRYRLTTQTAVTGKEALDFWLVQFEDLANQPYLPTTGNSAVQLCTVLGTDGDDPELRVEMESQHETVCALGGDDTIIMPEFSRPGAGDLGPVTDFGQVDCITVIGGSGRDTLSFERTSVTGIEAKIEDGRAVARRLDEAGSIDGRPCNPKAPTSVGFSGIETVRGSSGPDMITAYSLGSGFGTGVAPPVSVALYGLGGDDQIAGTDIASVVDGGDGEDQCYSDHGDVFAGCEIKGPTPFALPPPAPLPPAPAGG